MENPHELVRLATAPNPAQAHILEQALGNEGIKAKVLGDYLDAGLGDITGMMAEVWVQRSDLSRAEALLKEHEEKEE